MIFPGWSTYLKLSDHQYWFRTISEKFQALVLTQKDFRTNSQVISLNKKNFREIFLYSSESEDTSEWITEIALNQTNSEQNVTWIRLWLRSDFVWVLGTGVFLNLYKDYIWFHSVHLWFFSKIIEKTKEIDYYPCINTKNHTTCFPSNYFF